ncbi:MAG TPA: tRNA preQ1(34) S-adenosylmethionine ribosyltransferase-isomerase QueA [Terriglobales bacterium]|nr:tRNA preQ1(34) S-adenosylmethionine ribosyltransferase-isomerase QueA [Terriglobales bacterium]
MLVSEFDYYLPEELIAQEPLADRAASRMLHLDRRSGAVNDLSFRDLPQLLHPGDLLVFNNTRVFPARLYGHRSGTRAQTLSSQNPAMKSFLHGRVEVLLVKQAPGLEGNDWIALVRPGRKIGIGEHLHFGDSGELEAEVVGRGEFGERTLRFTQTADFFEIVERIGHVPLPPYIGREDRPGDRDRYQTVYARERGSVAAPTAGLHFTSEILQQLKARGVQTAELTLHVGLGTFQPVHEERVEDHQLHREWYRITPEATEKVNQALKEQRRVIAVGTTTVRTLEHAARASQGGQIQPGSGETGLFIYPGFDFKVVNALLTNFHLPKSTLLMLVSAFGGKEHVLAAYRHAVEQRYRFYSYGDCTFVE